MSVKQRFFTNEICNLISNLIDSNHDLDFLKTVSIGDLTLLPAPKDFPMTLPGIFIDINDVFNTANIGKTIVASSYEFVLRYVKYYESEYNYQVKSEAIKEASLIADTLLEDSDLGRLSLNGGQILGTFVPHIGFNTSESSIFENLDLPVLVIDINYIVQFRNTK